MMAAAGALQLPAIGLQQPDQFTTLHRVDYTHTTGARANGRSAAIRPGDSMIALLALNFDRRTHEDPSFDQTLR